jgi:6,7-dimethyl-8-ribityllumazine synthase
MSTQVPAFEPSEIPPDARVAIVAARFNEKIVDELLVGCLRRLSQLGLTGAHVSVFRVPGAFEIPVAAQALAQARAQTKQLSAIICLGCIVRGDTPHFDYIASETARGIQQVAVTASLPVIFGVLTTNTEQQAWDRTGGSHGHAGERAAEAALEMIAVLRRMR